MAYFLSEYLLGKDRLIMRVTYKSFEVTCGKRNMLFFTVSCTSSWMCVSLMFYSKCVCVLAAILFAFQCWFQTLSLSLSLSLH